jgi:hypothetical protein
MTSIRVTHATFGTNGQTTGQTMKSTSSVAGSVPATTLHHTSGNTPPSETPETNIEILVALLADEQRIQSESKSREADYKAKLDALRIAGHITDKLSTNGYTLSYQSRTTYKYPPAVTKQVKALQELAILNGDAESSTTNFWVLRQDKA